MREYQQASRLQVPLRYEAVRILEYQQAHRVHELEDKRT